MSLNVFQAPGNRALNFIDAVDASALPDPSTLNNGDYYVIKAPGTLWSITWAADDWAISDGTDYSQKSDATKQVAEGGTGATTAAGARVNLGVNGFDEDAEANGTKLVLPSLFLNGNNSYLTVPNSDKLSLVDSSDDIGHSVLCFVKFSQLSTAKNTILSKFGATGVTREWRLYSDTDNKIKFERRSDDSNYVVTSSNAVLAVDQWYFVCVTVPPCGPNSPVAFDAATAKIYINKVDETLSTGTQTGTYDGMANTMAPVDIGRRDGADYFNGYIGRVVLLNREITATEVGKFTRGNLPDDNADQWGDHTANVYSGDSANFASSLGNWSEYAATAITVAQSGGVAQITNTAATTGGRGLLNSVDTFNPYKRYRLTFTSRVASGTGQQLRIRTFNGGAFKKVSKAVNGSFSSDYFVFTPTGVLTRHSFEFIGKHTAADYLIFDLANNTGAGEVYEIDDIDLVPIGVVADCRAENFDPDTGKLHDESSHAFVFVNNNASLVGRALPVYKPGTFTPGLTFGGGSTGMVISASEGFLTRDGNLCHIEGMITLSAKGSSTGAAVITGLEFLGPNLSGNNIPVTFGRCANMANLTSPIIGNIVDNSNTIALQDVGAAGSVDLDETNFTDTTVITFSATYRIQ